MAFKDFFHYETTQIVRIRNVRVSLIHMAAQLFIFAYVVGYGIIYRKGYQATGQVVGSADIKPRGVGFTTDPLPWHGPDTKASFHVYDAFDLVRPTPMEENALFVTTNMWVTRNQTRGICPSYQHDNECSEEKPCQRLKMVQNGRQTGFNGSCRTNYTDPEQIWPVPRGSYCDVYAWCPTELERLNKNFSILGVNEFTIFVRMNVAWQKFGITLDNTKGENTTTWGVNLWTLEQMVQAAGWEWTDIKQLGITLGMYAVWNCDFDHPLSQCAPTITFHRLDDPHSKLSSGFNFRSVEFTSDQWGSRKLTKRYGVRLVLVIAGQGSQFDIAALLTAIGAGIGLLSVSTLVADFIATNLLQNKKIYKDAKYKEVEIADEWSEDELTGERRPSRKVSRARAASSAASRNMSRSPSAYKPPTMSTPLRSGASSSSSGGSAAVVTDGGAMMETAPRSPSYAQLSISPLRAEDDEDSVESWAMAHYPKVK